MVGSRWHVGTDGLRGSGSPGAGISTRAERHKERSALRWLSVLLGDTTTPVSPPIETR